MTGQSPPPLLHVEHLRVSFRTEEAVVRAVRDVSWSVSAGDTLAVVGESGSGKTVSALAVLGLVGDRNVEVAGRAWFDGRDLLAMSRRELRTIRGRDVGVIFQDPMTALHPVYTIGHQIAEQIRAHDDVTRAGARRRAIDLLASVGIPSPSERVDDYPHQFSGGMRQRVMIAMALSCDPRLIIADEPTTALDVTIQAQILQVLATAQRERGLALVFITHDLGVVARIADHVAVMYAGRIVERGSASNVLRQADHPYTKGLLRSIPQLGGARGTPLPTMYGRAPALTEDLEGCAFADRCPHVVDPCREQLPPLIDKHGATHASACLVPSTARHAGHDKPGG